MTDDEFDKLIGKYKSIEEFKLMLNKKKNMTTNKNKKVKYNLPTTREEVVVLWNRYRKANKTYKTYIINRYGYKISKNFERTLKERMQG